MTSTKMANFLTNCPANPIRIKQQKICFFKNIRICKHVTISKTTTHRPCARHKCMVPYRNKFKKKESEWRDGHFKC